MNRPHQTHTGSASHIPAHSYVQPIHDHVASVRQRQIGSIPPLKEPPLPPRRAASLMACTITRRAYWVVFKHAASGWIWERNIPAVPLPRANAESAKGTVSSQNKDLPALEVGGKYWGDWRCPGCGQPQIGRGEDYLHCHSCPCGMPCCFGSSSDKDNDPPCPNCGRSLRSGAGIRRRLSNTTHGKLDLGDSRTLDGSDRPELEAESNATGRTEIKRRKK